MAFGNPYSGPYYGPYYPQMYPQQSVQPTQQVQAQPQQVTQPQNQTQIQNGGFMLVPNEEMARTYPVAPGNCMTFKIEGKPIVMEKSMGFSQLEAPRIDKYRLVREEDVVPASEEPKKQEIDYTEYFNEFKDQVNSDLEQMRSEIDALRGQISKPTITKKKDAGGN